MCGCVDLVISATMETIMEQTVPVTHVGQMKLAVFMSFFFTGDN